MNLKPTSDSVIVRLGGERVTKSGIIIPDTKDQEFMRGQVVAVGPGKYEDGKLVPMSVKVGDLVLFEKPYDAEKKKIEGNHLIIKDENISAIIE